MLHTIFSNKHLSIFLMCSSTPFFLLWQMKLISMALLLDMCIYQFLTEFVFHIIYVLFSFFVKFVWVKCHLLYFVQYDLENSDYLMLNVQSGQLTRINEHFFFSNWKKKTFGEITFNKKIGNFLLDAKFQVGN